MLSILLLQSGGLLLLYKIQQCKVRYEMQQTMKKEETVFLKLTIAISEFEKIKINPHEISFQGKMYDITSKVISGKVVELLVIRDTKEETIFKKIKWLTENTDKQNNELPNQLVKFLTLAYICPSVDNKMVFLYSRKNKFLPLFEKITSFTSEILSPPPELV